MRSRSHALLAALLTLSSCNAADPQAAQKSTPKPAAKQAANAAPKEGADFIVLERKRFFDDKGYIQPVEAFSILVPRGWRSEGGVQWKSPFNCAGETYAPFLNISSPDNAIQYKSLPLQSWGTASDPAIRQNMEMLAQRGGCAVAPPMSAEQYLRQVLAPREFGNPNIVSIEPNREVIEQLLAKSEKHRATAQSMGMNLNFQADAVLARLQWPDGSEGLAFTTILNGINSMQNPYTGGMQQLATSVATERSFVKFPAARRKEGEQFISTLRTSYRTNPEWDQAIDGFSQRMRQWRNQNHQQVMAQLEANKQQMTAAHNQRMADIQRQGAANTAAFNQRMSNMDQNMRSWESQQASSDRIHTAFVQSIRGVETWQGPNGKVELTTGYENAWTRGDGTFILSNKPGFDPASAFQDQAWQPLKRAGN